MLTDRRILLGGWASGSVGMGTRQGEGLVASVLWVFFGTCNLQNVG